MSQYLLSVWHDDDYDVDFSTPEAQRSVAKVTAFNERVQAAGAWVFGAGLQSASTATVARPGDDEVMITDGPYAETKEQMGGFWIIEAADRNAAEEWARQAAIACERPVEVRPAEGG